MPHLPQLRSTSTITLHTLMLCRKCLFSLRVTSTALFTDTYYHHRRTAISKFRRTFPVSYTPTFDSLCTLFLNFNHRRSNLNLSKPPHFATPPSTQAIFKARTSSPKYINHPVPHPNEEAIDAGYGAQCAFFFVYGVSAIFFAA